MATLEQKVRISAGASVLFAVCSLPQVYKLTNKLLHTYNVSKGCPTSLGLLVHTAVFFGLTYLTMAEANVDEGTKIKHSLYGSLIFFLIASPAMYSLVASVLGRGIASSSGCPTLMGLLLHTVVFCITLIGVMYLP